MSKYSTTIPASRHFLYIKVSKTGLSSEAFRWLRHLKTRLVKVRRLDVSRFQLSTVRYSDPHCTFATREMTKG